MPTTAAFRVDEARSEERRIASTARALARVRRIRFAGHAIEVADERSNAATAPGMPGCFGRISAATPATCGEAIEVPLIHTYRPPPLTTARFAGIKASHVPEASVLDHPPVCGRVRTPCPQSAAHRHPAPRHPRDCRNWNSSRASSRQAQTPSPAEQLGRRDAAVVPHFANERAAGRRPGWYCRSPDARDHPASLPAATTITTPRCCAAASGILQRVRMARWPSSLAQ